MNKRIPEPEIMFNLAEVEEYNIYFRRYFSKKYKKISELIKNLGVTKGNY